MPGHNSVDRDRRAVLAAGGALVLGAALWPASTPAQTNSSAKIRIGVIGSGHIGGTVGGLWVKDGHPVLFSSRHPEELKDLVAGLGALAQAGTVDAGDRIRRCDTADRAVWRDTADRPGLRSGAQGQNRARYLQRRRRARRADRRGGRARRHRRDLAEVPPRHAAGTRLQHDRLHGSSPRRRTAPIRSSRYRSPATIRRRFG